MTSPGALGTAAVDPTGRPGGAERTGGSQRTAGAGSGARVPVGAFRTDIEGLRGVAVALVVAYHAGIGFLGGGYVGVDVFFVLSGFLITGLIVDQTADGSGLRFRDFYARRVRRLLPASATVLVATVVAGALFLPATRRAELGQQARSVALYVGNFRFAADATDYLRGENASPFQQFWSLAVEEQFYLVWPLLIAGLLAIARRRSSGSRSILPRRLLSGRLSIVAGGMAAVAVASFALSIHWVATAQPRAFFLLPARAWELAAGGLLAVGLRAGWLRAGRLRAGWLSGLARRFERRTRLSAVLGWGGLGSIALGALMFGEGTVFPGAAALLPVLGTVAILVGGSVGPAVPVLESPPARWLGRYSYGIYLWHWPLLIMPQTVNDGLTWSQTALAVGASVVAAVATFHLVEDRFRHAPWLRKPARSYAFGGVLTGIGLASTLLLTMSMPALDSGRPPVTEGERSPFVPAGLRPSLLDAADDIPSLSARGCDPGIPGTKALVCEFGDGTRDIALVGDSHAAQWFPAMAAGLDDHDLRLRTYIKSSCPYVPVKVQRRDGTNSDFRECYEWRADVAAKLAADPPELIVLGQYSARYAELSGDDVWSDAIEQMVQALPDESRVLVLRDIPHSAGPDCLLANLDDVGPCEADPEDHEELDALERQAVETNSGTYVDTRPLVCNDRTCPAIVGDILVWRDTHHMTATFARSHSEGFMDLLLAGR